MVNRYIYIYIWIFNIYHHMDIYIYTWIHMVNDGKWLVVHPYLVNESPNHQWPKELWHSYWGPAIAPPVIKLVKCGTWNPSFIDDFPIKTSVYRELSIRLPEGMSKDVDLWGPKSIVEDVKVLVFFCRGFQRFALELESDNPQNWSKSKKKCW